MTKPIYGHAWGLIEAGFSGELAAQSPEDLHQVIVQSPDRLAKAFDSLPTCDQSALLSEVSNLSTSFIESSRSTSPAASVLHEELAEPAPLGESRPRASMSKDDAVRATMHLVIGSILLRRALTIMQDPATGDAISSAVQLKGVDERVAARFYHFAASKGLVPSE
ncbi:MULTISPECIES: hypothetical protein [unclassified Plantibacter]|uniref:hypothetical protein n=1 Tax=unclassified Plantibacter TaxID=2624265 RepID=UPI000F5FD8A1|nr:MULTISPECIES: hypothetical protein [unclassified Plantibacter]